MRVSEIIRSILDVIDTAEAGQNIPHPTQEVPNEQFYDDEVRQMRQVADLVSGQQTTAYSNSPAEEYAGVEAVTAAGGGPNKPKHQDDIRGDSFRIHGDN